MRYSIRAAREQPFEVTIGTGRVIKGWDEAIPGMKVGELRRLTIPPAMAYGKNGRAQDPAECHADLRGRTGRD